MWLMWMKPSGFWAVGYAIGTLNEIFVYPTRDDAEKQVHYLNGGN